MSWNRPRANILTEPSIARASKRKLLSALALGLIGTLIVIWNFYIEHPDKANRTATKQKATTSYLQTYNDGKKQNDGGTNITSNVVVTPPDKLKMWLGQPIIKHEVKTNKTLVVETIYTDDGKKHKYYHDERENALPSGADQILAIMTAGDHGNGAAPLPSIGNFENAFGNALRTEIVVNDNDSQEIKEVKERVIAARRELVEMMSEGINANDFLHEWQKTQEDNATIRLEAVHKVKEFLREGDYNGAKELCERFNAILEKAGMMKIEIPSQNDDSEQ